LRVSARTLMVDEPRPLRHERLLMFHFKNVEKHTDWPGVVAEPCYPSGKQGQRFANNASQACSACRTSESGSFVMWLFTSNIIVARRSGLYAGHWGIAALFGLLVFANAIHVALS